MISIQSGASLYANANVESPRLRVKKNVGLKSFKIRRKDVRREGALARNENMVGFNKNRSGTGLGQEWKSVCRV